MKALSAPISVSLGVTNKCNLSCKHCLAKDSWEEDDLTQKEMLKLIRELGEAKVFNVALFGGEPLMRKDLFILIESLKHYSTNLSMNTNGTLITKKIAKKLKNYGIISLCISLDGSSEEIAESMRGRGSFRKNLEGIENAYKEDLSILLSATVTKYNFRDLRNIAILGKKIGVNQVRFNHVFYGGNAACFIKDIWLSLEEEKETLMTIKELSKEYGQFITGSYLQQVEIIQRLKKPSTNSSEIIVNPCGAAVTQCTIRPDGWVTPCDVLWEVKTGNIREQNFIDVWTNSKVMQEFRYPMVISLADQPQCQSCLYQNLCFRGHRCNPYFNLGGIKNRNLYCWLERELNYERICH